MTIKYLKEAVEKPEEDSASVKKLVSEIVEKVRLEGESALREYSERFDKWNPGSFRLSEEEVREAEQNTPSDLRSDITFLCEQVRKFAEAQKKTLVDFETETLPGVFLGQKYIPLESVGVYVPAGRYTLIASPVMSIVPARTAGVKRIVACTSPKGALTPAVVYAIHKAGADEIYSLGGAQAIAAMACGVKGMLKPVDMVSGPGNKYVVEAKRQVFGRVGIDLLAGPTEIGVIIDESADAHIVAADIIGQAEHDPDSPQILITLSEQTARLVMKEIEDQLKDLSTADVAREAWARNGEVVCVSSREEAVAVSDQFAPEHLEVQTKDNEWFLDNLRSYGSLFVGEESTVVYSDKAIGTNHILPTGRAARYTGGLWVGKYMKNVTYQRLERAGSLYIAPYAARIARAEGMIAHERSARIRIRKYSSPKA